MKKLFWGALLLAGLAVTWAVAQDSSDADTEDQTETEATETAAAVAGAPVLAQSLDQALGRPFVLAMDGDPAPLPALIGALDRHTNAVLFPTSTIDIFSVDVYALFMNGKGADAIDPNHPLREPILEELAKAEPGSGINIFTISVNRDEDGANRTLGVILIDTSTTTELSYLCMAVGLYDQARWFFTIGAQNQTYQRFLACHEQRWTRLEQAF